MASAQFRLNKIVRTVFAGQTLFLIIFASMVAWAPQAYAQDTVSGGSFLNAEELTEISQSSTLNFFDSNLGTLTSVGISFRGAGTTEITLVNNGDSNASISALSTEMELFFSSPNSDISNVFGNPGDGFPPILDVSFEVPGLSSFSPLIIEPDGTYESGDISEDQSEIVTFTDAADLDAFQQAGGGTFDVTCISFTQVSRTSTGGNLAESQVTVAACGMEITYNYTPETSIELTEGSCWRTLASPVEQSYADFFAAFETDGTNHGGLWTQGEGIPGTRAPFGVSNVYTLNPDGSDWIPVPDLMATMQPGTGVLISIFEDDVFDDPDTGGFPKTATFTGTGSPVSFDLGTRSGTTASVGSDDPNFAGFSLLGNPFNTAIDFETFYNNTTGIEQAAWVYDINATTPGWRSTNLSGIGDIEDGFIATGQAFVVQNSASPGTPSVDFQEEAKIPRTGTFYGKNAAKPDHLRIEVRGDGVSNSAWIQFSDAGTVNEQINGDVIQFYPFESEFAVLSTVKQGRMMDIGHFPYPVEQMSIPISIETTSTSPMTLRLTDLQLPATVLYLHDTVTKQSIELTEGTEYTFTPSGSPAKAVSGCFSAPTGFVTGHAKSKDSAPRFLINTDADMFTQESALPSNFSLNQNYPNPFNPTTQITYELPLSSDVRLEVFDMAGRQVATLVNESVSAGTHTVQFDATNLSSGVYMYRLQAGSTVLNRKLTLIK